MLFFKKSIIFLFLFALGSFSKDLKIAHVDSKIIFDNYSGTESAQVNYDNQVKKWEEKAQRMQKEVQDIEEQLTKQSLLLSAKKKQEIQQVFQKKQVEFQEYVQTIYGKDGQLVKKNEEFSGPIIKKIQENIKIVAEDQGYDLVLDRSSGSVVYWVEDNDITDKVLARVNKE